MGKHHHDATRHFSHLSTHEYKYVVVVANTFMESQCTVVQAYNHVLLALISSHFSINSLPEKYTFSPDHLTNSPANLTQVPANLPANIVSVHLDIYLLTCILDLGCTLYVIDWIFYLLTCILDLGCTLYVIDWIF